MVVESLVILNFTILYNLFIEIYFSDHSPRDFLPVQESYQEPTYTVNNVLDAVNLIFEKQKFN